MIKLSSAEEKAFNDGFNEEFVKLAQATSFIKLLLKGLKGIGKNLKISGKLENFATKALGHLDENGKVTDAFKKYMREAGPTRFTKGADGKITAEVGGDSGYLGESFAGAFNYVDDIKKGVSAEKGIFNKSKRVLKNLGNAEKQLYRDSRYRIIDQDKPAMFGMSRHRVVDGKLKGQAMMPDRDILGYTKDGKIIVKKRLLPYLAEVPYKAPSAAAIAALASGGDPKDAAKDMALWNPVGKVFGEAKAAYDGIGMAKNLVFGN